MKLSSTFYPFICCFLLISPSTVQGEVAEEPSSKDHPIRGNPSSSKLPWKLRKRLGVKINYQASLKVNPEDWPPEPISPPLVNDQKFARALKKLCGWKRWKDRKKHKEYGSWILESAKEFEVDPFLLGALVHRMSRCKADAKSLKGYGLTLIHRGMHSRHMEKGVYKYWTKQNDVWMPQEIKLNRYPFYAGRLLRPQENLYFAAGLLSMWQKQHETLVKHLENVPYRHYVSHFVWGDKIKSDRAEDRILTDRRRLLQYYGVLKKPRPLWRKGIGWSSPLDGTPRVISSFMGQKRDGGKRRHKGIDLESVRGEPVRAMAHGEVYFAGVDMPKGKVSIPLKVGQRCPVPGRRMGPGGKFICIRHTNKKGEVYKSCYMHLKNLYVENGQKVRRGERIGTVGRTGIRRSSAHLHFEMYGPKRRLNPARILRGHLIGHKPDLKQVAAYKEKFAL